MSIPEEYKVVPIGTKEAEPWLLKKHYAKCLPTFVLAYGLFFDKELLGVCTFGNAPTKWMNSGGVIFNDSFHVSVSELNRLVVEDGLQRNILSYLVGQALAFLNTPVCVVSYADPNAGHHGYIYQATNWLYTGESKSTPTWYDPTGKKHHDRHIGGPEGHTKGNNWRTLIEQGWTRKESIPKHRYIKFLGDKRQVREMTKHLKLPILPYPKGDNQRYDASYKPKQHNRFFV